MNIKIEKDITIPKTKWEKIRHYKQQHINTMCNLKKDESIIVKDRTRDTVRCWTYSATRALGLSYKDYKEMYLVKSIDKRTQRVWKLK